MTSTAIETAPGLASPRSTLPEVTRTIDTAAMKRPSETRSLGTSDKFGDLRDTYGNEFAVPDYSINDIRKAIPDRCFERNTLRGFGYVLRDLAAIAIIHYTARRYIVEDIVPSYYLRVVLWNVYGFLNGLFGTGLWVLAHECGHQAFSPYKVINDTVGFVLHSSLLVPYFSWKISHGKHHKATGHIERDMVFVPRTRPEFAKRFSVPIEKLSEVVEDAPLFTLIYVIVRQLFGWPIYLLTNDTGHNNHEKQSEGRGHGKRNGYFTGVNHLSPYSPLFEAKDAKLILLSDIGLLATGSLIYLAAQNYGWLNILTWYFLPYMWVNNWLVFITFLQHTDPQLPHYTAASWSYVRGAASTIDRDFGFIGRHIFHGIIETHVLHHYVSTIPFYNADLATEAIKPIMGKHYRSEQTDGALSLFRAMLRNVRMCQWVEPSDGSHGEGREVLFYRNRLGYGPRPSVMETRTN